MQYDTPLPTKSNDCEKARLTCDKHGLPTYYTGTIPELVLKPRVLWIDQNKLVLPKETVRFPEREVRVCARGCQYIDGVFHPGLGDVPDEEVVEEDDVEEAA